MFHDIFKKIKKAIKTKKQKKNPAIFIDIHEKNSLVLSEIFNEVKIEIKSLKIGDYLIGDVIVERKTVSDLISSMINKRLPQQLIQLKKYKKQMLIIEGDFQKKFDESDNISKALRGLIISVTTNYQIPVIFTKDYKETAKYLVVLAKQHIKNKTKISFHSRIPKNFKEQK